MNPLILTVVFGINPTETSLRSEINHWRKLSNFERQQQVEIYLAKNNITIEQLNQILRSNSDRLQGGGQTDFHNLIHKINSLIEDASIIQFKSIDQITLGTQDGVGGVIEK